LDHVLSPHRTDVRAAYLADETTTVRRLADQARREPAATEAVAAEAMALTTALRETRSPGLMEAMLAEYGLSNQEGVALMCLAEALLRVPDTESIDALIRDKIAPAAWSRHLGHAQSALVNASTWGLMLTGRVLRGDGRGLGHGRAVTETLGVALRRLGEPVIRAVVAEAMKQMGRQFVLGRDIDESIDQARAMEARGYTYSYDILGEAARTAADADRYGRRYAEALARLSREAKSGDVHANPGISIKLSSLHPRYESSHRDHCLPEIVARVRALARQARDAAMGLTIDAEEQDRLDLSLDVIQAVVSDPDLAGWDGFGVVVQSYGPRMAPVIDWLIALAEHLDRRIMVRLVKGAYWDTEIKRAQVLGLPSYPVFTRKEESDVAYLAGTRRLLERRDRLYPQFATHNARTLAEVISRAGSEGGFEVQRLHGMGEALHNLVRERHGVPCRIYAPVGRHEDLLAYLVRRILENGANSSFVNQVLDPLVPVDRLVRDPVTVVDALDSLSHPAVPLPPILYGGDRRNSMGFDLSDPLALVRLETERAPFRAHRWEARPLIGTVAHEGCARTVLNPANPADIVGMVEDADPSLAALAVETALAAAGDWAARPVGERVAILERAADLYEAHMPELMALATREAGKTQADGVGEVREAVDFLRYYGAQARALPLTRRARGVFVCVSPWNFPLAIFTGQIAAALVTGNTVIAKPAEQTCLMAARAVALLREAGVPPEVLALLPGDGPAIGAALTADPRVGGVCFTGSVETARAIHRSMADAGAAAAPLIAETGGLNAMIVDSTALPEQAVRDIVASAFQSAGQRCSALRLLCLQADIAERVLTMLRGAMDALSVGDPWDVATDVGPVIDAEARDRIRAHETAMSAEGRVIHRAPMRERQGFWVAPTAVRLDRVEDLTHEVFGPVLHVVTWKASALRTVVERINAQGYGLTLGMHSRIEDRVRTVTEVARVGNIYVNRNQIGAVVGVQPFGGEGLSGTGPKAGGPHYLMRFTRSDPVERRGATGGRGNDEASGDVLAAALAKADSLRPAWAARCDRTRALKDMIPDLSETVASAVGAGLTTASLLEPGPVVLPGPTGEANQLRLFPRGVVLCLGDGTDEPALAVRQAVTALALGCAVVGPEVVLADLRSTVSSLGGPIATLPGWPPAHVLEWVDPLAVVAFTVTNPEEARPIRRALARRNGPLVPMADDPGDATSFVLERVLSIDTTASGGNAALLARVAGVVAPEDLGDAIVGRQATGLPPKEE